MDDKPIYVTEPSLPSYEEYISEIKSIWSTHLLTNNGPKHKILEDSLKEQLQVNHVTLFTNGHLALEASLAMLGLKEGEIITTPYSFASTTHAITRNGFTPVFCDINEHDYTIDVDKIEELITEKTVAIVPVHVYGSICDINRIDKIAKKHDLKVIYDAAHAFGEEYDGINVANFGDISMFSFHATKVFNTIEGGALTFNSDVKYLSELQKNYGIEGEDVILVGSNAKMNEFQASMGICNLKHLRENISKREKIVKRYQSHLENHIGLIVHKIQPNVKSNYAYFPVIFDKSVLGIDRDGVIEILKSHNIFARKYFYPLISDFKCYKDKYAHGKTPIADLVSKNVLTLPLFPELSLEDVDGICEIILNAITVND